MVCRRLIDETSPARVIATGYGRHLLEADRGTETITEIKAVARGARELFPSCRTVIDIGGQDTKAVLLRGDGTVENFEMNDRCAAGTGKFMEIMAHALGYSMDEFGLSCEGREPVTISSLCTVFAESEVISLIGKGVKREAIARALHSSVVSRTLSLVKRVGLVDDVVFAGGCARNPCLRRILEERMGRRVLAHSNPDVLSAYGAALFALDSL
ncbi:MAG TPA: acyl-CoA dehydratase activase [Syntrophorhabdales bacterium]|nr:acyl-CoA dehydratase activase [Syntrophorhabdales bacterium]